MKRNIRITALLLAALTILPLTACNASLPPENDDVTTADSGSLSPDDPSTAQTPEKTNAPETTAPPETTPPAAELRLPTKEKPDPSVTRLLSANLIRYSELKENPDQPFHVFDFTQEKYQTQHSKDIVKNHDVSFAWKCTQAQQTVKLPEENYAEAWKKLIKLEKTKGILKRKLTIIDLRLDGKVVVKLKKSNLNKNTIEQKL